MNEINFEIQDIEKIDLSMDVGVKEICPPIENLTEELNIYNTELTEQEIIINNIIEALKNKTSNKEVE